MPMTRLVAAVRQSDVRTVHELLASGADVNELCEVEGSVLRRQEYPLYVTHALFEAQRLRDKDMIAALLESHTLDVNQPATRLGLTAFADACARGDVEVAQLLLTDSRVDPTLGCAVVAHPILFGCMSGNVALLEVFVKAGLVTDELEASLMKTAAASGQRAALDFLQLYYIDSRPFVDPAGRLTPGQQVVKIRREFGRIDVDANGYIDAGELRDLATALGTPLTEEELREAFAALNTAGDNRVDLDQFTAWWMGAPALSAAIAELAAVGGYAGVSYTGLKTAAEIKAAATAAEAEAGAR